MPASYCPNCFYEKADNAGPCPHCGYDSAADQGKHPFALPHGSILAGQFITGRVLGQGGFGITYLALDNQLKSKVAIKEFMPDSMAVRTTGTPQITVYSGQRQENFQYGMERFLDEAKVLAKFQENPNIVGVWSYFEENGTAYFVMEYVEGASFKSYIKEHGGKISWEEAVRMLMPVMDALDAVHKEGIIHRDVTPDNIFITNSGGVKLLDFGSARYSLGDKSRSLDVVLKAGYAPKEQYTRRGRQGPYTDVYSLAACLYSAITGYLPPESLDRADEDDLVLPSTYGISIPQAVEDVILHGLEVQPADRFQSMGEFRSSLDTALRGEDAPTAGPIPGPAVGPKATAGSVSATTSGPIPGPAAAIGGAKRESLLERIKALPKAVQGGAAAAACLVILLSALAGSGVLSGGNRSPIDSGGSGPVQDSGDIQPVAQDGGVSQSAVFPLERTIGTTIAAGNYYTVGLRLNGTVAAVGYNKDGQCDVKDWVDIEAVACGASHTVGLKSDGTVVVAGDKSYGNGKEEDWTDIMSVACGFYHTVGLRLDGTVVAVGWKSDGQCTVGDWSDIEAVACGWGHTVGLRSDGTVVAKGRNLEGQCNVEDWSDIVAVACGNDHTVGLRSDGTVVAKGRNLEGECNVEDWSDIVAVAGGFYHTVGLRSDGTVVAVGDNSEGQCNVKDWTDIVAVAGGYAHTVGLKLDGTVVAVGDNSEGQCDADGWTNILLPDGLNQGEAALSSAEAAPKRTEEPQGTEEPKPTPTPQPTPTPTPASTPTPEPTPMPEPTTDNNSNRETALTKEASGLVVIVPSDSSIMSMEDLVGRSIRTPQQYVDQITEYGGIPLLMAASDVPSALMTGTVDAAIMNHDSATELFSNAEVRIFDWDP